MPKHLWENRDIYVGMFPKTSGTPKSFILKGFSNCKASILGIPKIFSETSMCMIYTYYMCMKSYQFC